MHDTMEPIVMPVAGFAEADSRMWITGGRPAWCRVGEASVSGRFLQVEKGLLFASCMAVFLCQPQLGGSVLPFLAAIIISGLLSMADSRVVQTGLTVGYAGACLVWPELTFFLPLIAFDMPQQPWRLANLVSLVPLMLAALDSFQNGTSPLPPLVLAALSPAALLLRVRRDALLAFRKAFLAQKDETREVREHLSRRNRELLERQDADLSTATLGERTRIAREIHDNVGHLLASALMQTGALIVTSRDDRATEGLKTLNETLSQAMGSIRRSVHDLRDESVDLRAQLRALAEGFRFCMLTLDDQWSTDPKPRVQLAVIAVCREALANIMKHSDATQAEIVMREHPAFHQLVIRDNGHVKPFRPDTGMGLSNMEERIRALEGRFRVSTESGFEIFITIPKEEDTHARAGRG